VLAWLGRSLRPKCLDDALGGGDGRLGLPERFPAELEEGVTRGRVGRIKVGDAGQRDEDRIAPLDVTWLLAPPRLAKGEENGISSGKRVAGCQRDDRLATPAALDFGDQLLRAGAAIATRLQEVLGQRLTAVVAGPACARLSARPSGTARWKPSAATLHRAVAQSAAAGPAPGIDEG